MTIEKQRSSLNKQKRVEFFDSSKFNMKCYAGLEQFSFENGKTIYFLKVRHTKETIEQFSKQIDFLIKKANVVLAERVILTDKIRNEGDVFYKEITEIAKKYNKKVIEVDPERDYGDAIAGIAATLAPILTAIVADGYLIKKIMDKVSERELAKLLKENKSVDIQQSTKPMTSESPKKISRRKFLKYSAVGGVATVSTLASLADFLEVITGNKKGNFLEKFLLDAIDYRNAVIAREIISLSKKYNKLLVVYGARHWYGVKKFLEDRKSLAEKLQIYQKTFGIINPANKRVYDFSKLNE